MVENLSNQQSQWYLDRYHGADTPLSPIQRAGAGDTPQVIPDEPEEMMMQYQGHQAAMDRYSNPQPVEYAPLGANAGAKAKMAEDQERTQAAKDAYEATFLEKTAHLQITESSPINVREALGLDRQDTSAFYLKQIQLKRQMKQAASIPTRNAENKPLYEDQPQEAYVSHMRGMLTEVQKAWDAVAAEDLNTKVMLYNIATEFHSGYNLVVLSDPLYLGKKPYMDLSEAFDRFILKLRTELRTQNPNLGFSKSRAS